MAPPARKVDRFGGRPVVGHSGHQRSSTSKRIQQPRREHRIITPTLIDKLDLELNRSSSFKTISTWSNLAHA